MEKLTLDTVIERAHHVVDVEIDKQLVLMNVNEGKYYSTNKVGGKIWSLLEKPLTLEQIYGKLADIYDVTNNQNYRKEAHEYINILINKKLLDICTCTKK